MKYYDLYRRFKKYSFAVETQREGLTLIVESLFPQFKVISMNNHNIINRIQNLSFTKSF